ncbi:hypothetical protein FOPE_10756 [Fonsecaea pedrosoi]|nr:hypothetical protein FOPE_10756 [Fonsecaea pedrosoi]
MNVDREELAARPVNVAAEDRARMLFESLAAAEEAREEAEKRMLEHYDKKRAERSFAIGDFVLVSSKHIRLARASKKLADQFIGPFEVMDKHGLNAYTLRLPKKYGRLHHTFHVSLLRAYRARAGEPRPEPIDIDGEEEWEVEEVLAERVRSGRTQFHVRWKGYGEADDSWEPASNLANARDLIEEFRRRQRVDREPKAYYNQSSYYPHGP